MSTETLPLRETAFSFDKNQIKNPKTRTQKEFVSLSTETRPLEGTTMGFDKTPIHSPKTRTLKEFVSSSTETRPLEETATPNSRGSTEALGDPSWLRLNSVWSIEYVYNLDQMVVCGCRFQKWSCINPGGESRRHIRQGKVSTSDLKWKCIWVWAGSTTSNPTFVFGHWSKP